MILMPKKPPHLHSVVVVLLMRPHLGIQASCVLTRRNIVQLSMVTEHNIMAAKESLLKMRKSFYHGYYYTVLHEKFILLC